MFSNCEAIIKRMETRATNLEYRSVFRKQSNAIIANSKI